MNIILAKVMGIIITVVALSLLVNKKGVPMMIMESSNSQGLWWLYGFIALIIGALVIAFNNVWHSGLPLVVTICGWLALFKGIFILVFPNYSASFYKKTCRSSAVLLSGFVMLILGLALLFYSGFI